MFHTYDLLFIIRERTWDCFLRQVLEYFREPTIATMYRPPDKQQGSIDRQSSIDAVEIDVRLYFDKEERSPVGEYSISTSKRGTMIIRKRMTYFAFYAGAAIPWRTYPATLRVIANARTDAGDRNPTFAIFLKAHSDGLWLTRSHFHKLVLFRFAFPRRLFPPETSFLRGPFLTNRTNHGPKDGAYLTITITV